MSESKFLTTNGVNSTVYADDDDSEIAGHVVLCDYDGDGGWLDDDGERLPGITLTLESSEGNYHLWNLTVRSKLETLGALAELRGDPSHLSPGYRRGRWTLRTTAKERPASGIEKERPEVVKVVANDTDEPQSLPHWRYARAWWDLPDIPSGTFDFVGSNVSMERYITLTEKFKDSR